MQIDYLANHPHFIPTLAAWHHAMWGALAPGSTVEQRIARLTGHVGRPAIPTTLVAFEDATVFGSASLVPNDLTTHSHLTPFLASVYVGEPYRKRGIASSLVRQMVAAAGELGVAKVYLITPDQQALYRKLGWQDEKVVDYRGERVTLMSIANPH
ncbi:MAG: GNAT family N-acetyltransferase [Caldilineaceae bacterium]|nr:GNAT family N-acetyltransferase [Caldilineaceae bacterium]